MGDFAVKFRVRSKVDGFNWVLVAVYGAAQPELKPEFWQTWFVFADLNNFPFWLGGTSTSLGGERRRIMITLTADGLLCLIPSLRAWI